MNIQIYREWPIGLKRGFLRIEGTEGTPKKALNIEKVKIHGVGPLMPKPNPNPITLTSVKLYLNLYPP